MNTAPRTTPASSIRCRSSGLVDTAPYLGHGLAHVREQLRTGIGKRQSCRGRALPDGGRRSIRSAMGNIAGGIVAALTAQGFPWPEMEPVLVTIADPSPVLVHYADAKRHIGGYREAGRAIRLDRHVAQNFPHGLAPGATKSGVIKVEHVIVRNGHRFDDTQETGRQLIRWHLPGICGCRYTQR